MVRGWIVALLAFGVVVLGVAWRYRATASRDARRLTQASAQAASPRKRETSGSRQRAAAPGATAAPPSYGASATIADADLPWSHPGLCVGAAGTARDAKRAHYLATFVPSEAWRTTLYVHPDALASAADVIRDNLERVNRSATNTLGLRSTPPLIYLYPSVASLREHSCANANAVAYYDGAIHMTDMDSEPESDIRYQLLTSLLHEYAHHVLMSNGVGRPFWFQEGTALLLAGDAPHGSRALWREHPIAPRDMVGSIDETAPLDVARTYYANAAVMSSFLDSLCLARADCNPAELAEALINGEATPETLFDWAIARRGADLAHTVARSLWEDYVAHGDFPPSTRQALSERN